MKDITHQTLTDEPLSVNCENFGIDCCNVTELYFNPLSPGSCKFISVIFQVMLWIDISSTSCKIAVRWMPLKSTDHESTLFQVMAWDHQATCHYCVDQDLWCQMASLGHNKLKTANLNFCPCNFMTKATLETHLYWMAYQTDRLL